MTGPVPERREARAVLSGRPSEHDPEDQASLPARAVVRAREEDSSLERERARRDQGGRTPHVLLFGEALVGYGSVEPNLRTATQFTRFPGGADLNVAVGLSRLGVRATWSSV